MMGLGCLGDLLREKIFTILGISRGRPSLKTFGVMGIF
jgi:hypothetical protein